ncbi:MAG: response regulator [Crocinitomicaceae bacterium]|nr:response regulator [Crocinitomicaceae bacterium]MBK8924641.1 response regulator [Crocinitomicaceae bacterium]
MSKKIALIEDNLEMRENIQEILQLANYEVHSAENGKKGVELIKNEKPDLILCDIMMPELDGYGVLYMVSKNPETASIPFIFLTAKSEREDFRKGMSMGADDYLTKPFEDTELLDAIERRLNRIEQLSKEFIPSEKGLHDFLDSVNGIESLEKLTHEKRSKKFNKKDSIFFEGDFPNFLYFVNSGKIKTSKMNKDGKDFITGLFNEGDFFGYTEMIKDCNYTESATALENSELTLIPREDFLKLLYSSKDVSSKFIKMLAGNMAQKQEELLNLAYDTVRKRVADSLLKLNEKYNPGHEPGFSMSISRDDLAAIVGTATESVIRTLSEFKADGYINIKGSNITILSPEKLKNFRF